MRHDLPSLEQILNHDEQEQQNAQAPQLEVVRRLAQQRLSVSFGRDAARAHYECIR